MKLTKLYGPVWIVITSIFLFLSRFSYIANENFSCKEVSCTFKEMVYWSAASSGIFIFLLFATMSLIMSLYMFANYLDDRNE